MSKFLAGFGIAIALIVLIGVAYFFGRGQFFAGSSPTPQATTVTQTVGLPSPSPSPETAQKEDVMVNPSKTIAQIESSVSSKNYQALEAYMASSVNVILYASECCGPRSSLQATQQLDYLNSATPPWNFNDNNPIAAQLRAKNPEFFKDAVIGTSSNRYAVGFTLNDKYLISNIVLVADYELITK